MTTNEGIIKYQLNYSPGPALDVTTLSELNAWRRILYMAGLIGQDPARYGGYGFGNISRRLAPFDRPINHRTFVITGTQTGDVARLTPEHFTTVVACHPERNLLIGEGPIRPSSESLTHGTVYDQDPALHWVMHAHSPEIWRYADALGLPVTAADVPYGSPEMAAEVARLFRETDVNERRIFSMGGHEDGIVTFGRTSDEAGSALLGMLARALALMDEQSAAGDM